MGNWCDSIYHVSNNWVLVKLSNHWHTLPAVYWPFYFRLGGYEPFATAEDTDNTMIYERIIKCDYKFDDLYWENISLSAKDVISKLLVLDPAKRLTAIYKKCLEHKICQIGTFMNT